MNNFQVFEPNNFHQLITGIIFYASLILVTFLSISSVYVLMKYATSRSFAFAVSILYSIVFLGLVSQGISILNSIN